MSDVDSFIRCDVNNDRRLNLTDAVWMLNEAFVGGEKTLCPIARDCDANDRHDLSDVVYALAHLFMGGPLPPQPYPDCGQVEDMMPEDCPGASTVCP